MSDGMPGAWSGSPVCPSRGTAGSPARSSALTCTGTTGNHSSRRPTLPATCAPASYTPNPTNRPRSEERGAQRGVGRQRVGECEHVRLGARPLGFRSGSIPPLPVQIGAGGMYTPRRRRDLELVEDRQALLDVFLCTLPVLLRHRDSGLQVPRQRVEVRLSSREGRLEKAVGFQTGLTEVS